MSVFPLRGGDFGPILPESTPERVLPLVLTERGLEIATANVERSVSLTIRAVDAESLVRMFKKRERGEEWS